MNTLPIWRKRCGAHALDDLRARLLGDQCIYILFPEGTRTRTGEIARFKPGLGRLVAGTNVPVVPCHLRGAWEALPPGGNRPNPVKITLRIGRPLSFEGAPNEREELEHGGGSDRSGVRRLADGVA